MGPTETDATSEVSLKPKIKWSSANDEAALGNSCALNALLMA